jgi:hypothetical protein
LIFPECLRLMIDLAERDPRIAIVGAYTHDGTQIWSQDLPWHQDPSFPTSVLSGRDACRLSLLNQIVVFGSQTSVLYRANLVRNKVPFYVESSNHADTEVCFELLDGHMFGFIHQILSFARRRNDSITASIRAFHPFHLRDYIIAKKYGRRYLTSDEYDACISRAQTALYAFLAWNIFHGREKAFWDYQRKGLELAGESLDFTKLYLMQIPRIFNMLGNPKATIERIIRYLFFQNRRRALPAQLS